jgi:hypothetical protein
VDPSHHLLQPAAQQITSKPKMRIAAVRVVIGSCELAVAPSTKVANVDIQRFS